VNCSKALANDDTLLPTQMFPHLPARATFVADANFKRDSKNVSDFFQKYFVSATNVSQFALARKRHEQQCFRNNVSSWETYVAETNFAARKQKMFLLGVKHIFVSRTQILLPQHMFPSLATMFPQQCFLV